MKFYTSFKHFMMSSPFFRHSSALFFLLSLDIFRTEDVLKISWQDETTQFANVLPGNMSIRNTMVGIVPMHYAKALNR
ncbi:MAG: hypothetical protein ACI4P0_04410, partial [Mailhella sp.]